MKALLLLLTVAVAACGTVEAEPTAKDGAGGNGAASVGGSAGGAGGAGGEIGGAGEAGHAGASGAAGTTAPSSGGATGSAGAGGGGGGASAGGQAGHPAIADCPRPIASWGTWCPNKYPDGTTCVLGCIYDNAGQTYEPAGGSCYVKSDFSYGKPLVCLPYGGGLTTCASCPR